MKKLIAEISMIYMSSKSMTWMPFSTAISRKFWIVFTPQVSTVTSTTKRKYQTEWTHLRIASTEFSELWI